MRLVGAHNNANHETHNDTLTLNNSYQYQHRHEIDTKSKLALKLNVQVCKWTVRKIKNKTKL